MARIHRLTAREVETAGVGTHADGGCLYLRVRPNGSRAWVFRATVGGRVREIGLGATHTRTLKEARAVAAEMRRAIADGRDPALIVRPERPPPTKTFAEVAEELIASKGAGWRNPKHRAQWLSTLRTYAYPIIGDMAPRDITIEHVLSVLRPLWTTKPETASRLRQRVEAVLDYAKVLKLRTGENPAGWNSNLEALLPSPRKVRPREHHAAAHYSDVPRIMAALAEKTHVSALALRFIVLTGCRSGEGRGARWSEIDLEARVWTVPGSRMKAGKPHRVPLSDAALEVLRAAPRFEGTDLVFVGARGAALSDVAVSKALRAIEPGVTVHGFRSSFRIWAEEAARAPRSVSEAALAHVNRDAVEAAYMRSDLFELRRELMESWGRYCTRPPGGNVVPLSRRANPKT
jgi:integrase